MSELDILKNEAKIMYKDIKKKQKSLDHLDCGNFLKEHFYPDLGIMKDEFNKLWARVKELDPMAPDSPFIVKS